MAKTFIRFQLHKARTDKTGLAPVKVVYHLNKPRKDKTPVVERKFIPTDKKIHPLYWQGGKAEYLSEANARKRFKALNAELKAKGLQLLLQPDFGALMLQKDVDVFNADLEAIKADLRAIEKAFEFEGKNYTLQNVIDRYYQRNDEAPQVVAGQPKIYITDFIDDYVQRNAGLVNAGTLQTYIAMCNQLKAFAAKKADRITFANLDKMKLDDLLKHYVSKGFNNSTTSKHFSNLKKMIRIAISENKDLEVDQSFRDYNPKILSRTDSEPDVVTLEQHEFDAIMDYDLTDYSKRVPFIKKVKGVDREHTVSHQTLDKVRNLFVFSCVSGFRISDIEDLKREHIQGDWIIKKQVKGGKTTKIEIPLNAISKYILSLYEDQAKPLPSISNQKANDYLKVLGRIAGINSGVEVNTKTGTKTESVVCPKYELISMHMGRRVFTSLTLAKGGAMQDVMNLTGHKKFASFKRYVSISKTQKQNTMNLWGEIAQPKTKMKAV